MNTDFDSSDGPINITNEERMLGLFSHLSIFFGGLVIPLIFWLINKDKSKFVTFHSLQALWFQIAYAVLIILLVIILIIGGVAFGVLLSGSEPPLVFMIIMFAVYGLIFLMLFPVVGYSIYMAIKTYKGEMVKYPIIGKMVYKKVFGI